MDQHGINNSADPFNSKKLLELQCHDLIRTPSDILTGPMLLSCLIRAWSTTTGGIDLIFKAMYRVGG